MIGTKSGVFTFRDVKDGFKFEGCGYLDSQITFISEGKYKITILYKQDGEEKSITLTGKGISRISLSVDSFCILSVQSEGQLKIVINNIKDYFFDLLSEN